MKTFICGCQTLICACIAGIILSACSSSDIVLRSSEWTVCSSQSDSLGGVTAFGNGKGYLAVIPSYWNKDSIVVYRDGNVCTEWSSQGLKIEQSALASVIIATESGSMDEIDASEDKSVAEQGNIALVDEEGNVMYNGELESIHGRGNKSWTLNKKPYNIKLSSKTELFDFRKGKSFCLLTTITDPCMLRNKMSYLYAEKIGMPYSIKTHYVSLWTNGEYRGVYLLTEKVSAGASGAGLNVDEEANDGGTILEVPQTKDVPEMSFNAPSGYVIALKDPKRVSKTQFERIRQRYLAMDASVMHVDPKHHDDILDYLDVESFARYYLLQELFYNKDAYTGSFYMYKNADTVDSLIYCAPLWDMDNSMKASLREASSFYNRKEAGFISSLCANPIFWSKVQDIYNQTLSPAMHECFFNEIDSTYSVLRHDISLDSLRWNITRSAQDDFMKISRFMKHRLEFLDEQLKTDAERTYHSVVLRATPETWEHPSEYIIENGKKFSLDGIKTKYNGLSYKGCYYRDGSKFDPNKPIVSDTYLEMKWESTDTEERLSGFIDQWRVAFGAWRKNLFK